MNNNQTTEASFKNIVGKCRDIFEKKTQDYGTAWRILRLPSITDQINIKALRIRSIQEKGVQKIDEGITSEFYGILNYCVMGLIQLQLSDDKRLELPVEEVVAYYEREIDVTRKLLLDKNHDYGEAWRDMRVTSITDIILMKLLRVKQIEDNKGNTLISEGIDANYRDILNYSVFALILLLEE